MMHSIYLIIFKTWSFLKNSIKLHLLFLQLLFLKHTIISIDICQAHGKFFRNIIAIRYFLSVSCHTNDTQYFMIETKVERKREKKEASYSFTSKFVYALHSQLVIQKSSAEMR